MKYVPGISFRTDNGPFKVNILYCRTSKKKKGVIFLNGYGFNFENLAYFWLFMKTAMQGFTQKIVQMMKAEKLYEPQGGPIILSQV